MKTSLLASLLAIVSSVSACQIGAAPPTDQVAQGAISPSRVDAPPAPPVASPAPIDETPNAVANKEEAPRTDVRRFTTWSGDDSLEGKSRAEQADLHKRAEVEQMFADAGVTFPPAQLYFRVFKTEGEFEVWASSQKDGVMERIATYEVCRMSGEVGPKRREGDLQVPEGFYKIEYFWPDSAFHLSAKVSYPNPLDRQLGGPTPGSDIMIHGGCASIGCIAMSDERIEELWVMGTSVIYKGQPIPVHIFPARDMDALLSDDKLSAHHAFWQNIRQGLDLFERERRVPITRVGWRGEYEVAPAAAL